MQNNRNMHLILLDPFHWHHHRSPINITSCLLRLRFETCFNQINLFLITEMLPFTGVLILLLTYASQGILPALSASVAGKRVKGEISIQNILFSS